MHLQAKSEAIKRENNYGYRYELLVINLYDDLALARTVPCQAQKWLQTKNVACSGLVPLAMG